MLQNCSAVFMQIAFCIVAIFNIQLNEFCEQCEISSTINEITDDHANNL